ncbi:MAG: cysteine synthase family protein [Deltaproteobacteria bacterium]|nr:cysteine synthase family protein [Deltaproteobacteria bacterium]
MRDAATEALHQRKAWLGRLVGRTPSIPIEDAESGCTLWVKLEYLLPSGSTKDRVAAYILAHGVETGAITPSTIVVEASSGSTSIALAMAAASLGVRFCAVMPGNVSRERVLIIRRYGGTVRLTPVAEGVLGAIAETRRMAAADPQVFLPRQFENPKNALAHARETGPELAQQIGTTIHGFVAGVGTGGTLMGIARALREAGHPVRVGKALPEKGSVCFSGQPEICGGIPGVVEGLSAIVDPSQIDLTIGVPEHEAIEAARWLCARGLAVGPSSGLNFAAARKLAKELGPGHTIATVLCDRMERYFSTDLFDDLKDAPA